MQEKRNDAQKLLDMVLCDMSPPLGIIRGYGELLEEYLAQLAEQGQVTAVTLNPDMQVTPQEALEWVRTLLKSVGNLDMLKHNTREEIRRLYDQE